MKLLYRSAVQFLLGLCIIYSANADVRVAKIFGPGMVLQRDTLVSVWGWGDPGEIVKIRIQNQKRETKADQSGFWKVIIGPYEAGGPYELIVQGKNEIRIPDVMFGEVWLCGGQSNMQFTLRMLGKNVEGIPGVNNDLIRLFQTELDLDYLPKKDLKGGIWKKASKETVPDFSAVAYYFGKNLYDSLKVPIGLVSTNLGATTIETWMSVKSLKPFPQFREMMNWIEETNKNFRQLREELASFREDWDKENYLKGPGFKNKWYEPDLDISDWKTITIPNFWEYDGLDHDGAVWFRKKFDLPPDFEADTFHINLNQIDDYDITWVNGIKVGESFGNRNWRNYKVPASILKPTGNDLVVRIFDIGDLGGMYTSAFWGNPILLGEWKYKPGLEIDAETFPTPVVPNGSIFSYPTLLYNGSIAPINSFVIKGVIWYQGESNVPRAKEYSDLLPALIRDWREKRGYNFAFLVVQLANYGFEPENPVESSWAELREAQGQALNEPNSFLAITIDIGEAKDIHPGNKEEVGRRLALGALKRAYGKALIGASPEFDRMTVNGNKVSLTFKNVENGLKTVNKFGYIRGFQIAGDDKKFYWTQATLEGNQIILTNPEVKNPVAVRYAWADNPGPLDLYNHSRLPLRPFRTDDWPLSTEGQVYVDDPHQF